MTEAVHSDYEVSSEGAVRHWEIPYARLQDATPTPTMAARVTARVEGAQLCGTILTVDAGTSMAMIDFTPSMVYRHDVRTVLTYGGGPAEASWGALNIGDTVYYDDTACMPAGVVLSTSPLDGGGNANPIFGWIVASDDTNAALFPLAAGAAGNTHRCAVMQRGAGA